MEIELIKPSFYDSYEEYCEFFEEEQYREIKDYLSCNGKEGLKIAKELNSYDGSFDFTDVYDPEELIDMIVSSGDKSYIEELIRAIRYGNVCGFSSDYWRYDAYANLEEVDESDLEGEAEDYAVDILNGIINNYNYSHFDDSCMSDELKEAIEWYLAGPIDKEDIEE